MDRESRWAILECCVLLEEQTPQEIEQLNFFEPNQIKLAEKLFENN